MAKAEPNEIEFSGQAGVKISFTFNDEYRVTKNQPFESVSTSGNCLVTILAGRSNSTPPADWFSEFVNSDERKMIHTKSRGNKPIELNFAVKGTLEINGESFQVCFGQGHQNSIGNNWHLCAPLLTADKDGKNGYLGDKYYFTQDGTHKFLVQLRK